PLASLHSSPPRWVGCAPLRYHVGGTDEKLTSCMDTKYHHSVPSADGLERNHVGSSDGACPLGGRRDEIWGFPSLFLGWDRTRSAGLGCTLDRRLRASFYARRSLGP